MPPIDSITAGSDIKAFLQAGVPQDLTRAALRRAWTADPAIRDFIGLAENQWDFTDPTAMPGFGPLEATDDLRQLVSQAMGRLSELAEDPDPVPATVVLDDALGSGAAAAPSIAGHSLQEDGITQENANRQQGHSPEERQPESAAAGPYQEELAEKIHHRRAHGSALPK